MQVLRVCHYFFVILWFNKINNNNKINSRINIYNINNINNINKINSRINIYNSERARRHAPTMM